MKDFTPEYLERIIQEKGYLVYTKDSISYNLNLIGIRSANPVVNKFNDLLVVMWKYQGLWSIRKYVITTLPGKHYLDEPMSPLGCAILVPGQYRSLWKIGMHFDQEALVQNTPCAVYRDANKDNIYDYDPGKIETGNFGIDCHRKNFMGVSESMDLGSAGCQVHADALKFENDFMPLMRLCRDLWGNLFTYTLLEEKDLT